MKSWVSFQGAQTGLGVAKPPETTMPGAALSQPLSGFVPPVFEQGAASKIATTIPAAAHYSRWSDFRASRKSHVALWPPR
jgi:hypothetical protein